MEKEPQPDSISVTVKEYAPSEVYSNEPPPAYQRPRQATAVQVARIIAYTVVAVSFMLGAFMLASAYITSNASCAHLQQELLLLQEAAERFQVPEALVQEEPIAQQSQVASNHVVKTPKPIVVDDDSGTTNSLDRSEENSSVDDDDDDDDDDEASSGGQKIQIKLPLQLDFDELAGALMEQNQRSRMNCIVEKKRNDEVIDHQPRSIRLPFGLNLTTDPRYERVTGEKMAIYCESGNEQRHSQPSQTEDVIMHVQPFMVPLAAAAPAPIPYHQHSIPQQHHQQPPAMHPQLIAQQIAHVQRIAQQQQQARMQHEQEMQRQHHHQQQQQQQAAQIIPHFIQEIPIFQHQQQQQVQQPVPQTHMQPPQMHPQARIPEALLAHAQRLPIPEELLTQLNRLPNEDVIAIQVTEDDSSESNDDNSEADQSAAVNSVQEPKPNGRQMFARGLPVHIPVPMMQELQQPAPEEQRPHYLHPRSVRSVDNPLLHREKRVKRCSCDCSC